MVLLHSNDCVHVLTEHHVNKRCPHSAQLPDHFLWGQKTPKGISLQKREFKEAPTNLKTCTQRGKQNG